MLGNGYSHVFKINEFQLILIAHAIITRFMQASTCIGQVR